MLTDRNLLHTLKEHITAAVLIIIDHVSKAFGTKTVLEDVSLHLSEGQTHVLIGASGSGKSTLLRLICGLISIDPTRMKGRITLDGTEVSDRTRTSIFHKIGYVVQEGALFPHLSAFDNVALVARTRGWTEEKIRARVHELSSLVSIDEKHLKKSPRKLSGGQRQRIALMRALAMDPDFLLLDEPLGALDPIIRSDLQEELRSIFRSLNKTVVLVTHDMGEAAYFGNTISMLKDGKVLQHGQIQDFLENPQDPYVTRFINAQKPPPEIIT